MLTNEQKQKRNEGIGGSDMPIILGLSNYKTPYQLYLEKIGESPIDMEMTPQQYWGHVLEGLIRDEFARRHNVIIEKREDICHPFYDFMRGNLDGFIPQLNAVLEIKCANQFMAQQWGEDGSDIIPMPYLVQVAHYCAITNADRAFIAVLIGGNDYREFVYERDLALETKIIDAAKEFWQRVQDRNPPEPINQIDLRLLFPKHDPDKTKTINTELSEQLTTLSETRFKIKQLNEIEEKYKFNIMQFMGDAEVLVNESNQPIITWKTTKRGSRTLLFKGVN